jgi:putative SOS response-associated peptidase YedK
VPRWAKDRTIAARLINARAESAAEKPAFRDAFRTRRCLVPADGFYEWGTAPTPRGRKPAWLFGLEGGEPFAFAALWESWREPGSAAPLESVALLTTAANDLVGRIHDRMPVIVPPADFDRWLAPPTGEGAVPDSLLAPFPSARMTAVAVGPRVGDARNDDAGCVEPVPVT